LGYRQLRVLKQALLGLDGACCSGALFLWACVSPGLVLPLSGRGAVKEAMAMKKCKVVCLFLVGCVFSLLLCLSPGYGQSVNEYKASVVPAGHDFTKIDTGAEYKSDELIIRFKLKNANSRYSAAEKTSILNTLGVAAVKRHSKLVADMAVVKLPAGVTIQDALKTFNQNSAILYAEPNYKVKMTSTPTDTLFSSLWGMHNAGQYIVGTCPAQNGSGTIGADIDAPEAWDIATDASDIIVAVIDTGIDYNHEDLADNMWVNQAESNGTANVDDDGNGYIDDIYGYDFINNDSDPIDDCFHGTHCAGTIGAVSNNNQGVTGVCWQVQLMALKFLGSSGSGNTDDAIEAIEYAVDNGAQVLSNSWGTSWVYEQSTKDAIAAAGDAGVLFVAAAGNESNYEAGYPAGYDLDNIISVMASDGDDERSIWPCSSAASNWGATSVDLAAPGSNIYSTTPTYLTSAMYFYGIVTYYDALDGTSMATPHVAGACALLWSRHLRWDYGDIKYNIMDSVDVLSSLSGLCVTGGRLNLYKALTHEPPFMVTVADDISLGCVGLDDYITYTIYCANPITNPNDPNYIGTTANVVIIDNLPASVGFDSATGGAGMTRHYNAAAHTYTWEVGSLAPGESVSVTITVQVNGLANPLGKIANYVEAQSDDAWDDATENTPVCCWNDTEVIYVDPYATGSGNGRDWPNAYTDLQTALTRAANSCGSEIWVARGTYSPGSNVDDSFTVPDGVELYGGFAGTETTRSQRDHTRYQTILTGYINETTRNKVVVTMGDSSILDGFVVEKGNWRGIEGINVDFSVYHCTVKDNTERGINCEDGNLTIQWCEIKDNGQEGIYHKDSNATDSIYYTLMVENCKISGNQYDGIKIVSSAPQIKNSFIYRNGFGEYSYHYGINLLNPSSSPIIRNNTIVHNGLEGIKFVGSTNAPGIRNCIIWYNNGDDPNQLSGYKGTYYTCITDPSDPNVVDPNSFIPTARGNIKCNPKFTYSAPYPHNYHLKADSPCINKGNNTGISNEKDIDNNDRIINATVDMGADELSCEDVENTADFNSSGIVNLAEFAMFSAAWLSEDPNDTHLPDPDWNSRCDMDDSGIIDLADLVALTDNWLWSACWRSTSEGIWSMMMAAGGGDNNEVSSAATATESPTAVEVETPTMTTEEQIAQLTDILDWLEKISQDEDVTNTITEQQWQTFIDDIIKMLENLKTDYDDN
jgi:subtilisin family serine protease